MYTLINQNINLVLATLDYRLDIDTYLNLIRRFNQGDISHDPVFHLDYRRYWRLNAARLSEGALPSEVSLAMAEDGSFKIHFGG